MKSKITQPPSLPSVTVPMALLAAILLAFGLLSPWLGFYQDDWHFIYYAFAKGLGKLWELSNYDHRPFASWPYITGFALLGFRPFGWQVAGLVMRWLTAAVFWMVYHALWPKHVRLGAAAAILFAIYPLYTLQPQAVTYITHWVCYFLFGLSLYLMILGVRNPRRLWPLLLLSILLDAVQLFTIEYFNGLELLRPLILWFVISAMTASRNDSIKKTFLVWLPYLFVLGAFIVWRGFIYKSPDADTNAPVVLYRLFSQPLATLGYLIVAVLKDTQIILAGSWENTIQPGLIDFSPAGMAFLAAALIGLAGGMFYLRSLSSSDQEGETDRAVLVQALCLGSLGLLLGPIPAWVSDQPMYSSNPLWNSRLGMASMFGAALILAGLVEWIIRTDRQRLLVYGLLIGLSINYLLHSENGFRYVWSGETDFYTQLTWRAPSIEPNTAIITDQEIISYMGDYPMGFAINAMYAKAGAATNDPTVPYWYYSLENNFGGDLSTFTQDQPLTARHLSVRFKGTRRTDLMATYAPSEGQCLWILRPEQANAPYLPDIMQQAAGLSDLNQIGTRADNTLFAVIFGNNPPRGWCYYFEKAQLAQDQKDWQAMAELLQTARQAGFQPGSQLEYFPFLEAYSQLGDWKSASDLLQAMDWKQKSVRPGLCFLWNQIEQATSASPERDQLIARIRSQANCQ